MTSRRMLESPLAWAHKNESLTSLTFLCFLMGINIVMEHVKVALDAYRELVKIHEELGVVISHRIHQSAI